MALGWLALSAQVAVGQPEHGFYCALVTGLWLFTREAGLPWRCRATRVALLGAGAVALAAPQLLPMALYFPETWRVKIPHPELAALWLRDPLALVFPAQGFPNIRPSFYGAATLALAALGCVSRRPRAPFLGVAALVAFLLALGPQTPIYGWLHHIPPFRFFRGPIKFESLVEFATAWLAAVGVDRLWRVRRAAVLAAGTLLVLTAVAERFVSVVWEVRAFAGKASGDANGVAVVQSLARSFLARERGEGPPPLVLDGMTFLGRYAGNLTVVHGMASLTGGPVAMLNRRERQLVELSGPTRAMLDLFGVRFVLVPRRDCTMAVARLRLAVVEESRAFCVLANPTRPPRYVILPQISAVASEEDMIAAVGRDPAGPVPVVNPPSRFAANAPMSGTVELLTYSPGNVRVRARAAGDALLLVRESWVNGWQARVDGAPVPLYPAAGIYFAVPLPAGVHEVQVRYRTPGFRPGLLVALGWLVLIGAYRVHGSRSAGARGEPAEG
jgi:hypothetical protein